MPQLSFFSSTELAEMRDPTKARNYSAERAAFRRDHQRRRDHGKARRHAERIYRAFQQSCEDDPPPIPTHDRRAPDRADPRSTPRGQLG